MHVCMYVCMYIAGEVGVSADKFELLERQEVMPVMYEALSY